MKSAGTISFDTIAAPLRETIATALDYGASDIHLKADLAPVYRIDGKLTKPQGEAYSEPALREALFSLLSLGQRQVFERDLELDAAISLSNNIRIRINIYGDVDTVGGAIRIIPNSPPPLLQLGAPPVIEKLTELKSGLVIVSGVTGAGKTTLLASMIETINQKTAKHVYTIEDPIEFVYKPKQSIITQREIGQSTRDFATAVRSSLRADPDILMVGEMRDRQTVMAVMEAAETGLLVLTTLHTGSAIKAVQRILSMFQPSEKESLQMQLSTALKAVICQQLLPSADGKRKAMHEILISTGAVREALEKAEFEKMHEYIENGSYDGMQSMDATIFEACSTGLIDSSVAVQHAINPDEMNRKLRGAS